MGDIHGQNIGHNHSLQKRYLSFYIHYINTVSFKQKGYCWTARTGRKMPKKCLGHVFKTLSAPHDVVQLSVNFWHLCLLGLGANLVLGSILVGNHLCKVAPKSENSLLFFFRVAMGSGPFQTKKCFNFKQISTSSVASIKLSSFPLLYHFNDGPKYWWLWFQQELPQYRGSCESEKSWPR